MVILLFIGISSETACDDVPGIQTLDDVDAVCEKYQINKSWLARQNL